MDTLGKLISKKGHNETILEVGGPVNRDHLVYLFMGLAVRKREGIENKFYNNDAGVSKSSRSFTVGKMRS